MAKNRIRYQGSAVGKKHKNRNKSETTTETDIPTKHVSVNMTTAYTFRHLTFVKSVKNTHTQKKLKNREKSTAGRKSFLLVCIFIQQAEKVSYWYASCTAGRPWKSSKKPAGQHIQNHKMKDPTKLAGPKCWSECCTKQMQLW